MSTKLLFLFYYIFLTHSDLHGCDQVHRLLQVFPQVRVAEVVFPVEGRAQRLGQRLLDDAARL